MNTAHLRYELLQEIEARIETYDLFAEDATVPFYNNLQGRIDELKEIKEMINNFEKDEL